MTKPLSAYDNPKYQVIRRRIESGTMGLGFWSAIDAIKRMRRHPSPAVRIIGMDFAGFVSKLYPDIHL